MKDLIEKYELKYKYIGIINKWDFTRPYYTISILGKNFEYFGSYNDFKQKKTKLTNQDLLLAFRCVIQDITSYIEVSDLIYKKSIIEFGLNFGYLESEDEFNIYHLTNNPEEYLTDNKISSIKNLLEAYNGCREYYNKLYGVISNEDYYKILDKLSELGIE